MVGEIKSHVLPHIQFPPTTRSLGENTQTTLGLPTTTMNLFFLYNSLDLQDPGPSQTSSSCHQYSKVLSPATKSLATGSKPVSDFLAEIAAAGVSCCPAFPPRKAIHVPNRQRTGKGSSISTVHFTVSVIIYSTWILYIHCCVLQTLSSQREGRRWENSL